jgi:hypothetical protein
MSGAVLGSHAESKLWNQAVADYISKLDPADAQTITIKKNVSSPTQFLSSLKHNNNSAKKDRLLKSFQNLSSALLLLSSAVPEFTSVAWCSAELLYNVRACLRYDT